MGAHESAPSQVLIDGQMVPLDQFLRTQEIEMPYLLKVLAAASPLSIQAHPDRQQAQRGFAREQQAGVPIDAPHRIYRDPRPKPELFCALERSSILAGFRPWPEIAAEWGALQRFVGGRDRIISAGAELSSESDLRSWFAMLLSGARGHSVDRSATTAPIVALIAAAVNYAANQEHPRYRWVQTLAALFPGDPGCLAPLYLNVFELEPRQALYLPPRTLHAHLSGLGVEIMGNSDNVLRGGCTPKWIDAQELAAVVDYRSYLDSGLDAQFGACSGAVWRYATDAAEFELWRAAVHEPLRVERTALKANAPLILFVVGAAVSIAGYGTVRAGQSVLIMDAAGQGVSEPLQLVPVEGAGRTSPVPTVFVAGLPASVRAFRAEQPRLWVDADSCPRPIRPIIVRAAERGGFSLCFVANRPISVPGVGPDQQLVVTDETVDQYLLNHSYLGHAVITRDIPLAEQLVGRGVDVLNDRGTHFEAASVRERRSFRDAMVTAREMGLVAAGSRTFGARETKAFADALDRFLARRPPNRPL